MGKLILGLTLNRMGGMLLKQVTVQCCVLLVGMTKNVWNFNHIFYYLNGVRRISIHRPENLCIVISST